MHAFAWAACGLLAMFSLSPALGANRAADWLIDPAPYQARAEVSKDGRELVLGNPKKEEGMLVVFVPAQAMNWYLIE